MYIKKIADIYNPSSQVLNMTVISKCGFVIGYLDKPKNENFFPGSLYAYHQFNEDVRLFDASCPYTPYISYVLVGFFIYFLLKKIIRPVQFFMNLSSPLPPIQHPHIVEQLRKSNIISLENLHNLLLNTTYKNNHHDRLFIVYDKYLVMLMINLEENSPEVLRKFYNNLPFMIIPMDDITSVKKDCIVLDNDEYIYFPSFKNSYYSKTADWLHERLMSLNDEYRYKWDRQEFLNQEAERQRHLRFLIAEETQYQQRAYEHDILRILQPTRSASPRFIAQFRLAGPCIVNNDMLYEHCDICFEDYQSNRQFAQWPCTARHTFHFNCMLNLLRTRNKCPVCRHPVEETNLPSIETVIALLAQRTMATIFN